MDREQYITKAKENNLPDYIIQELLDVYDQCAKDGNPMPYDFDSDMNSSYDLDNELDILYAKTPFF